VQAGPDGNYVFVITADQRAELRPVQVARGTPIDTILSSGVKPGETVVTDGHLRLVPGSRVTIKPDTTKTNATKTNATKTDATKTDATKTDATKVEP
jgi:multidrug efflux system membrane fusion protein